MLCADGRTFSGVFKSRAFPVRSMQRRMGTRIIPFAALLEGAGAGDGSEIVRESAYLRVRKLLYHIEPGGEPGRQQSLFRMGVCKDLGREMPSSQYPGGGAGRRAVCGGDYKKSTGGCGRDV